MAIADAYDAMTNDRPYKGAVSHDEAIAELRRHAGTQFDPELVTLFCDLFATTAPKPDPTIAAMTRPVRADDRRSSRSDGSPPSRRRHPVVPEPSSGTMGPENGVTIDLGRAQPARQLTPEGQGRVVG